MRTAAAVIILGGGIAAIIIGVSFLNPKQIPMMMVLYLGFASFIVAVTWLLKNLDNREKEIERRETALKHGNP